MSRRPGVGLVLAMLVGLALAGCDGGDTGPGVYSGSVELTQGSPGSVLLLLSGGGVRAVVGEGGTQSWSQATPGEEGGMRALLMDPDPSGAFTFRVEVDDITAPAPAVSILEVADRANQARPIAEAEVRLIKR